MELKGGRWLRLGSSTSRTGIHSMELKEVCVARSRRLLCMNPFNGIERVNSLSSLQTGSMESIQWN